MKNAIVLCSGGLDSVVTAYYVKKKLGYDKLMILFFDYNQRTVKAERRASKKCAYDLGAYFKEIKLKELAKLSTSLINSKEEASKVSREELKNSRAEHDKYYVPFRNGIFLSYAVGISESLMIQKGEEWDIFLGFKCEGKEAYPDTTPEFVRAVSNLMKVSKIKGKILAPLIKKDKDEIVKLGQKLGADLNRTYSCYISNKTHCGTCLACRLRQEAFYWANIRDDTEYKERMRDYRKA